MSAIPLHLAAFDGDIDSVNRFLAEGASVDTATDDGETALFFAATRGYTDTVRTLLKWGADVNIVPIEGGSPLRQAVRGGYAEIVRLLLAKGADPEASVPSRTLTPEEKAKSQEQMRELLEQMRKIAGSLGGAGSSVNRFMENALLNKPEKPAAPPPGSGKYGLLKMVMQSGSVETLKVLLDAGYSPIPPDGKPESFGLLDMAKSMPNGMEMARLLLQYGADPNGGSGMGTSPLMMAVMSGDVPFARLLIEAGARTESNQPGMSLLSVAVMRENKEMIELLLDHNIGGDDSTVRIFTQNQDRPDLLELIERKRGTAWLKRVEAGDVDAVKAALQNGADIHARNEKGETALYLAAEKGDAALVRILLEAGADANRSNEYQMPPLHIAATKGATSVIALLLEHGATMDIEDLWHHTPLRRAAMNAHQDAADLFVAHGAILSVVDAIYLKRTDAVNDFWSRGTPVTYANEAGVTPLHAAVTVGDFSLVSFLLDRGAAINAAYRSSNTPLSIAITTENIDMVRLLLDRGASLQGSDSDSMSFVESAATHRNEPILRLLLERGAPIKKQLSERASTIFGGGNLRDEDAQQARDKHEKQSQPLPQLLAIHRHIVSTGSKEAPPAWQDMDRLWGVVRILIEFGADVDSTDWEDNSILESCIEFGAPIDLIRSLIDRGAAVNPTTESHKSPFTVGVQKSPLMEAVQQGRADVVEALLVAGADPNGGVMQKTPLQIARDKERPDIAALLESHGATDAKREAVVSEFGDLAKQFLLPAANESSQSPLANMRLPDFGKMLEMSKSRRSGKIAERRERLMEEIRAAGYVA